MPDDLVDVIIVGAGPAGVACALGLAGSGLKVKLIDKDQFPREKVCAGGLWLRSVRVLDDLLPFVGSSIESFENKLNLCGISVCTPDGGKFIHKSNYIGEKRKTLGYTVNREDFDEWLVRCTCKSSEVEFIPSKKVDTVQKTSTGMTVSGEGFAYNAKIVVFADGAQAGISGKLTGMKFSREKDALAVRAYFKHVKKDDNDNVLELCFLKEVFPGYMWLFPLPDDVMNVGVYIPLRFFQQHNANLKRLLFELIQDNSQMAFKFQDATLIGSVRGGLLPLGKKNSVYSGENFLVAGDAASLVDPLGGEGIGNALYSGQLAAKHILECVSQNNFSASFNKAYDKKVLKSIAVDFEFRHWIVKFMQSHPSLFNYGIKKVSSNLAFRKVVASALASGEVKKEILSLRFLKSFIFD
jgi:geranylgeranyl reductase family protein